MKTLDREGVSAALEWLENEALRDTSAEALFRPFCESLVAAGLPLLRAHLAMRTLHPLVSSLDMTWWRDRGFELAERKHAAQPAEEWLRSPLFWMINQALLEFRQPLDDPRARQRFPILDEFAAAGASEYYAVLTPFGNPATAIEREDGVLTSWVTDAPGGFTGEHMALLARVARRVGLVAKLTRHAQTARNIVSAYLGADAGKRVLAGQIRLGDVERIPAVIWYSDLRDSTAMAERMPVDEFFAAVNAYFGCTASAVIDSGGEVLRFIGDAVLAVFPIDERVRADTAARSAQDAATSALARLADLNRRRAHDGLESLGCGIGLHVGEVLYGNIGIPTRLEFSVIGSTANQVCRIEGLTKELGEPVLASAAFCDAIEHDYRSLGTHRLKGVSEPIEVFAPTD